MKKILAVLVFLFAMTVFSSAYANHIPVPNLPVGERAAYILTDNIHYKCGSVTIYRFLSGWLIHSLNGKWLAVIRYDKETADDNVFEGVKDMEEIWFDNDQDGHLDEHYTHADEAVLSKKYPDFCSVVRKRAE
ncbi:MAG: hypothetical protein Q8P07_02295 [bacterium]|nr:hypothetical protein [bacterium]